MTRPRSSRTSRRSLAVAIAAASVIGLTVATGFSYVFGAVIYRTRTPWAYAQDPTASGVDVLRLAFYATAGLGAVAALVVTYRKQALIEQQADDTDQVTFAERFQRATEQLGSPHAAVRMGGVYAVASLADTYPHDTAEYKIRRQQCIDTLCGYLRLPYAPRNDDVTNDDLATTTTTREILADSGSSPASTETRTYSHTINDRQVRLTIISTIRNHLVDDAGTSWRGHDFDFTGATFDGGDFRGVAFAGGNVTFDDAIFASGNVDFEKATFAGGRVTFRGAKFIGSRVFFNYATFAGGAANFFYANFAGGNVSFRGATITNSLINFNFAPFTGGNVNFDNVTFAGGNVTFFGATFSKGRVHFNEAAFIGSDVSFLNATFDGSDVDFTQPSDWSVPPRMDWRSGENPPKSVSPTPWPAAAQSVRHRPYVN
jgi:uncharacterized protein YjbI with pentapeptide repeats